MWYKSKKYEYFLHLSQIKYGLLLKTGQKKKKNKGRLKYKDDVFFGGLYGIVWGIIRGFS